MAASKDDQSVPESVEGRSQHDSRVKNPITTDDQYLPYPKDDRGPYNDNEAVLGGRKENENLYDYPANDRGYDIQGPQGQNFQHGSAARDLPFSGRTDQQEHYEPQGMNYMPFSRQDSDKELISAIGQLSPAIPFYKWYARFEYYASCFNLEALFDQDDRVMNPRTKFAANRLIDNTVCEQYKSCYRFDEHPKQKLVLLRKFFGRTRMINDIHDDLSKLVYDGSVPPTDFISAVLNLKQEIECGNHNNSFDISGYVLRSLRGQYHQIALYLEHSREEPTIEVIFEMIHTKYERLQREGFNTPRPVNTMNRRPPLTCYSCGGLGHRSFECPEKPIELPNNYQPRQNEPNGNFQRRGWNPPNNQQGRNNMNQNLNNSSYPPMNNQMNGNAPYDNTYYQGQYRNQNQGYQQNYRPHQYANNNYNQRYINPPPDNSQQRIPWKNENNNVEDAPEAKTVEGLDNMNNVNPRPI